MPAYKYTALNAGGRQVRGITEAENDRQARRWLREHGLTPVEVNAARAVKREGAGATGTPFSWRRGLSADKLALFTQTLATLLKAGMPVDDALTAILGQAEDERLRTIVLDVRGKLVEGHSLESALAAYPEVFDPVYRATAGAGEQTRHLPLVLARLGEHVQHSADIRRRITGALVYPAVLVLVSLLVVGGLLVFVVPDVVAVFAQSAAELPVYTRILIALSTFLKQYGGYLMAALLIFGLLLQQYLKRPAPRRILHSTLLRMPLTGAFIRQRDFARFAQTLSVLLGNGVEMIDALNIAGKSSGNLPIRDALEQVSKRVREGESLFGALKKCGYAPGILTQLAGSGESSGELPTMLDAAATALERNVNSRLTIMLNLLEPLLILTMGSIVLFIVLAILPILNMNSLM